MIGAAIGGLKMTKYKCSVCGGEVTHMVLLCIPPINKYECGRCGLKKQIREEVVEVIVNMEAKDES